MGGLAGRRRLRNPSALSCLHHAGSPGKAQHLAAPSVRSPSVCPTHIPRPVPVPPGLPDLRPRPGPVAVGPRGVHLSHLARFCPRHPEQPLAPGRHPATRLNTRVDESARGTEGPAWPPRRAGPGLDRGSGTKRAWTWPLGRGQHYPNTMEGESTPERGGQCRREAGGSLGVCGRSPREPMGGGETPSRNTPSVV